MKKSILAVFALFTFLTTHEAKAYDHAIYGAFGINEGGFALGVDYEHLGLGDFGVGGLVRLYQKDDDNTDGLTSNGYTVIGGFIRPHFSKKNWDLYFSPGLAIIQVDSASSRSDKTTLGGIFGVGLMYELSGNIALGVENMGTWVWFAESFRGKAMDDLMFKFRLAF